MRAAGDGGELRFGGQIVADLAAWDAEVWDGGELVGKARLASEPNSYYMEHGHDFKLTLFLGKMDIRGQAVTAVVADGYLHFHLRRERDGKK